jgi:hypothetical protein
MTAAPRIDYFALGTALTRKSIEECHAARREIEYLVAMHGPVDVLRAARKGLETHAKENGNG